MTRGLAASSVALALLVAVPRAQQQPTFRSVSDVVAVQVSVHTSRSVVSGLTAADFALDGGA